MLQNQLCRLLLKERGGYYKQNQSTNELLNKCEYLSIHQLGAQSTIMMIKKIILSQKPVYLADKLVNKSATGTRSDSTFEVSKPSLSLTRSSFLYRGIKLYNQLPEDLRKENNVTNFKKLSREWTKQNISVKP